MSEAFWDLCGVVAKIILSRDEFRGSPGLHEISTSAQSANTVERRRSWEAAQLRGHRICKIMIMIHSE